MKSPRLDVESLRPHPPITDLLLLPSGDWRLSVRQRHRHLHVVDGEVSRPTADGPLQPVLVDLADEVDDVALAEAQLPLVLWLKVIQGSAARLGCRQRREDGGVSPGNHLNKIRSGSNSIPVSDGKTMVGVNVSVEGYKVSLKEDSPEGQDEILFFSL